MRKHQKIFLTSYSGIPYTYTHVPDCGHRYQRPYRSVRQQVAAAKAFKKEVTVMLNYSMLYPRESVSRRAVSLDGMWKFCLDWDSNGENNNWQEGIPGEDMIPVPASFQDFYTDKDIR